MGARKYVRVWFAIFNVVYRPTRYWVVEFSVKEYLFGLGRKAAKT